MTKRFECIGENMQVSIKDNESEMSEYPFSLCCESVDDFETLVQECLQMVGLLNHLHQENNYLSTIRENQQQMILKLKEENEQLKHWNKCLAEKRHNEKESNENSIKKLIAKIDFLERVIDGDV